MEYLRPLWSCLSGLCSCSLCTESNSQRYEPSERTHLLADPQLSNSPALRHTQSESLNNEFSQSLPKKDDQNALGLLVQNTAVNMIDVAAMDSHNLEHQEYHDRIKLYSERLKQQWSNVQQPGSVPPGILKDVPNPEVYLTKPLNMEDMIQIKNALNKTHTALMDLKIDHKEAIVVPFRIP